LTCLRSRQVKNRPPFPPPFPLALPLGNNSMMLILLLLHCLESTFSVVSVVLCVTPICFPGIISCPGEYKYISLCVGALVI